MSASNAASRLRVGIVGAGGISRQHAIGWTAISERAEIGAIADVDTARAQQLSDEYTSGAARVYDSIDDLVADPGIDVVDICLPHHLHTEAVLKAADAGKAILCEKPLCTTIEDASRIKAKLEETGVVFMGAHNQLFQPTLIEARRIMASGYIGQPYLLRSIETFQSRSFDPWSNEPAKPGGGQGGWRADVATSGGGELLDTGYHGTYRLLALANAERPVEVTAFLSRHLIAHLPTEDTALVVVRFESGLVGEILTSWAFDVTNATAFEVMGELGALSGSGSEVAHQMYRWPSSQRRQFTPINSFSAEIEHFANILQRDAANPAAIDQTARVLQLIKGAYLSAQQGRTVSLPEDASDAPVVAESAFPTPSSVEVPEEILS